MVRVAVLDLMAVVWLAGRPVDMAVVDWVETEEVVVVEWTVGVGVVSPAASAISSPNPAHPRSSQLSSRSRYSHTLGS